jgi:hypothetical protein
MSDASGPFVNLSQMRWSDAQALRHDYLDGGGWETIDGWLYLKALRLTDFIDQCQDALNINGNIGEIGIYFGKYFILLYLSARREEKVIGVDLFAIPKWEKEFYSGMLRWKHGGTEPLIVKRNSLEVAAEHLLEWAGGPYRLFSVDGGHSLEVALHDLRLANAVMVEGGVIMVDDYFDPKFPGVSEAVNRFFLLYGNEVRVEPFLITGGKLFLATKEYGKLYREAIYAAIDKNLEEIWDAELFGSKVTTIL